MTSLRIPPAVGSNKPLRGQQTYALPHTVKCGEMNRKNTARGRPSPPHLDDINTKTIAHVKTFNKCKKPHEEHTALVTYKRILAWLGPEHGFNTSKRDFLFKHAIHVSESTWELVSFTALGIRGLIMNSTYPYAG